MLIPFYMCQEGSTGYDFVRSLFPPDFIVIGSTPKSLAKMLLNDARNVMANDRSFSLDTASSEDMNNRKFVVGNKLMTKEPLAKATQNNDGEFLDVIDWVVQALIFGEEQGQANDSSLCQKHAILTSDVSDLNFLNAVYCMGNYGELFFGGDQNSCGKPNQRWNFWNALFHSLWQTRSQ